MIDIHTDDVKEDDHVWDRYESKRSARKRKKDSPISESRPTLLKEDFARTSNRCDLLIDLEPYDDKVFGASEVKTKKPLIHSGLSLNGSL